MRTFFRTLKSKWAEYIIEIIVLIIGISLSLFFNDLRAEKLDRKNETLILQSIQENLTADTAMLEIHIKQIDFLLNGHSKMLEGNIAADSAALYIDNFATYSLFEGQDVGYQELKQSQSSRIITNRVLLQKIITHYEQKLPAVNEWNSLDKQFVLDEILPFLNKNMKYSEAKYLYDDYETTNQLLESDDYFKNMIKSGLMFKQIIKQFYMHTNTETKKLINAIEEELND